MNTRDGIASGLCLVLAFVPKILSAATVTIVEPTGRVEIDADSEEGYKTGSTVCFFNAQQKPVACGIVQSIEAESILIAVKPDFVPRLSPGMSARLITRLPSNNPAASTSSPVPPNPAPASPTPSSPAPTPPMAPSAATATVPSKKTAKKAEAIPAAPEPSVPSRWSFHLGGLYIPKHLVSFHPVSYAYPINRDTVPVSLGPTNTLWNQEQTINQGLTSNYFAEISWKRDWQYNIGFRTSLLGNYTYQSNYDLERQSSNPNALANYASTDMSGQDYGGYLDLYPLHIEKGSFSFAWGTGLDINQSRLLMAMDEFVEVKGEQTRLAQYTSTIRTLSLRILSSATYQIGSFALKSSLILLKPIQSSFDTLITVSDPQMTNYLKGKTGHDDLEAAIKHDITAFSAQVAFSLGYIF